MFYVCQSYFSFKSETVQHKNKNHIRVMINLIGRDKLNTSLMQTVN